jgi:histidine triad (HIT) family protein
MRVSETGEREPAFSRGAARGGCVFCKIIAGDAPAQRVHEDASTLSFMDLFPASRGHLLVVPKRHFSDILGADEASLVGVIAASRRLALAMKRALAPDGIGVHQLNGAAAGQTIFHYHMHLIPRRMGDPIGFHGRVRADANELAEVAAAIARALGEVG